MRTLTPLIVALSIASGAAAQSCTWTGQQPGPNVPYTGSMVFDTQRNVTVLLYNGSEDGEMLCTFEWDGHGPLVFRAVWGAPGAWGHASAFDQARARTVYFGGYFQGEGAPFVIHGETFEWDGQTWHYRTSTGPAPRYGHAMAYDTVRAHVLLYGGTNGTPMGDLWEWDGTTWTDRTSPGPGPHEYPALAYDSARGKLVMHGADPAGALETWEWDSITAVWTRRALSAGPSTAGALATFDSARARVIVPTSFVTWEWDGQTWTPATGTNFTYGTLTGPLFDSSTGRIVTLALNHVYPFTSAFYIYNPGGYANCDHSTAPPVQNAADFQCFLNKFAAGDPYANCDGSTTAPVLNVNDFMCFLNQFAAGCT